MDEHKNDLVTIKFPYAQVFFGKAFSYECSATFGYLQEGDVNNFVVKSLTGYCKELNSHVDLLEMVKSNKGLSKHVKKCLIDWWSPNN